MSDPAKYEKTIKHLREQYHEIAQLAGALAHEIKNPLSVIGMNMELLAEDLADIEETPKTRRALGKVQIVQRQCVRLQGLLDDFLKYSRVAHFDLTPGNLNEQIDRVLDLFEPQARETNVEIVRYLDPDLPSILLDEKTLQASLVNLIKNAIEAMPHDGELTARTRQTRHGVALDLIDTGKGMDQTTAMHMFEAFFSTKDGGSGLGLPTTRKWIEAHGGRIDVQSAVGKGTKFTIEFPVPTRLVSESTTCPSANSPSKNAPSTDNQSTDNQSTDNQSTDNQSTDNQSTDNQSTGDTGQESSPTEATH